MIFTDTHSHLYSTQFDNDIDEVVAKALEAGIKRVFLPNVDLESIDQLKKLTAKYPDMMKPMMGLHPCEVKENYKEVLDIIYNEYNTGNYIAVGEIGMDLYWDKTTEAIQADAFITQCKWAAASNHAVSIHCREAIALTIELLQKEKIQGLKGVFHCFGGSLEQAKEVIEMGFMLGIGGVVTYKNTHLRETLTQIDLKHIVIETDSPYLAPVPYRSKRNDTIYLIETAKILAGVYGLTLAEIAQATTANSIEIFGC
ncbi:MAG: TatD family hydrolase [Bacteroidota bacterium]|nr:TatD family hydrolase [Bacteroidota bacterium]